MKAKIGAIAQNIFPGFVVSLVALPLSLGLALASGAPPVAGIISAIVGGMLVSLIGGSNVTITGPGNGLVVVTLSAITTMGAGDPYQGYLYALGAIVISGLAIFLFGLLRVGALGDFFPSAAVQGMLAAIGVIIMAKQLHLMIGVIEPVSTKPLALLLEIPQSISLIFNGRVNPRAWIFGLSALIFLFLYPRLRSPVFKLIPAPMWVVLIGILYNYSALWFPQSLSAFPQKYLLQIPDKLFADLAFPDFGKIGQSAFWSAVISLSFISSIESLLSLKAVDRLDPIKRRSNVNRALQAIGLATVASGFLGGLNVVKVIARSSVNVNQGATHRASNFFHGLFLLLFMLLFSAQLQKIPLPGLAAILVYTGYKLTSPEVFRNIYRVGWEQLVIFLITMITTLASSLITGITVGVLATLFAQLALYGRVRMVFRNLLRPNSLLLKEDETQYHISIRAFSSFLNFLGLKRKLDTLPPGSLVIVDFSLAEFVDYSVLEQLVNYHHSFRRKGGDLEIIGLDNMSSLSLHPLSSKGQERKKSRRRRSYSRREKSLRLFSRKLNWEFKPEADYHFGQFDDFAFFQTRTIDNARNRAEGWQGRVKITLADIHYYQGEYDALQHLHSTMVRLFLPYEIPKFVLNKENLLDRVAQIAGFREITFEMHPDFSRRFNIKGNDQKGIRHFFDRSLIDFLEENKAFHIESNGQALLIFEKERLGTISEIKQLVSFANRLAAMLNR